MKPTHIFVVLLVTLCITSARAETVLITGSNRGIGLEFVKQYAARGWTVIATARAPEAATELKALAAAHAGIRVEKLDVVDVAGIRALAAKYAGTPIDVLVNNAGVLGALDKQELGSFDFDEFQNVMGVNTYGPLAVSDAFHAHVAASRQKKIVAITSGSGQISVPVGGGSYFYKASKIGLNMVFRALASDLAAEGIIVTMIAPGSVNTDMRRASVGVEAAARDLPVNVSVAAMIKTIDGLSRAESGHALNYDGRVIAW
jgi:NAD(P)-dependent dehydrogenase (short-subunit alcohol dehydrogenase family)